MLSLLSSDSSSDPEEAESNISEESVPPPLDELFGDEVSGDAVPPPAPLPQRAPAPVMEANTDHMAAVEELVEALARPFTVSYIASQLLFLMKVSRGSTHKYL